MHMKKAKTIQTHTQILSPLDQCLFHHCNTMKSVQASENGSAHAFLARVARCTGLPTRRRGHRRDLALPSGIV